MKEFNCSTCGSNNLQQLKFGLQVSEVISISIDDGLVCDSRPFEPSESTVTKFRCGACKSSLEIAEKDIINFLRFGGRSEAHE